MVECVFVCVCLRRAYAYTYYQMRDEEMVVINEEVNYIFSNCGSLHKG